MADELREKLRAVGKQCLDSAMFAETLDGRRNAEMLVALSDCLVMVYERVVRAERHNEPRR